MGNPVDALSQEMKRSNKYLTDLARFVPVLTGPQILHAYFDNSFERMRRTLRAHEAEGFITLSTELVRPRVLAGPLATIIRGHPLPSPHQLAYSAEKLWSASLVPTLIIRGTAKLSALYGGEYREVITANLSHEVALTSVLFAKRGANPDFEWTLVLARPGEGALPDAIAADAAIEVLGRYSGATVSAKLAIAAGCTLEIW